MLTHLEPQDPKNRKNMLNVTGPKNTVNYAGVSVDTRTLPEVGGRGRSPSLLRRGEKLPYGKDTARGPLAGFKG